MDTNRIKRFATEARNILKAGIAAKITTLGFNKKGNVAEEHRPQLMQGGTLWNGQFYTEGFYHQWMSLYNRIQQKGINEVYEEAAYTWFNRLCAIRILQKNNLCSPVLQYADAARTPIIVDEARQGHLPQMKEDIRQRIVELLDDDTKVTEQFALLITAWCHDNPILNQCFGSMADYTELLLPNDILAKGKFMDMLNHTEFITDEEFQSPELIGWLYQFYISERKDEVFAKKGKFEADEIPAATQIFTPNWIVKYMVQNTVGRIYLDNNPYETALQKKWQYLVEPSEKTPAENILRYEELTDLKVADLACGSGHILNECFDLLYELYIAEGYGRGEAIENIFKHNLTGVDIDNRAKQLATFALLLKACQKDASFADAHCLPNVLTMPKPWNEEAYGNLNDYLSLYFQGKNTSSQNDELTACFELMQDADSLGSIMKFNISDSTHLLVKQTTEYWCRQEILPDAIRLQLPAFKLILTLTEQYHALIANPPYMGRGNMNATLSSYLNNYYPTTKADLFAVFMEMMIDKTKDKGRTAFITMESWMFLSSFETFRHHILSSITIDSLIHMPYLGKGWTPMGISFGTAVCIVSNGISNSQGTYQCIRYYETDKNSSVPFNFPTINERYSIISQRYFKQIPGWIIGYWVSEKICNIFLNHKNISDYAETRIGLITGDNEHYIRFWHEISFNKISFNGYIKEKKWYPQSKGGEYRKWYGNNYSVLDWSNNGFELQNRMHESGTRLLAHNFNLDKLFQDAITWTKVSSGNFGVRYQPKGFLFNDASANAFTNKKNEMYYIISLLNSKVTSKLLKILNPTLNVLPGSIGSIPLIINNMESINKITIMAYSISKQDWDSHEISWDFETNPLLTVDENTYIDNINYEIEKHKKETGDYICIDSATLELDNLQWRVEQYKKKWEQMFNQLHENEEELNRQFIEIYGLQDELTPDVPLNEITILQQGEIKITDQHQLTDNKGNIITDSKGNRLTTSGDVYIDWQDDVIIKQLISYAVGCMMGRYRLDKPGLHIAHPEPTTEEIAPYSYHSRKYEIDDDGILPLMNSDCGFSDNVPLRMADFVRIAFGEETQVENLNYMEQCLGKTIEQYFVKDFWKDHKKMYQNRPIYWLFASKKGTFQVIAYMHRMNAYTVERIRAKYLLPFIEHLEQEIKKLDMRRAELTTKESKQLQTLQKQLDECREYHERLQVVAEQAISFDLDDGVAVNYAKFGEVLQKIK